MNSEQKSRINKKLRAEFGPIVTHALSDPEVIEIMLNSDGILWIERLGEGMKKSGQLSHSAAQSLMSTIASSLNTSITIDTPILEGELPLDGSRFEGLIPPVVAHPTFTITKKNKEMYKI